MEATKPKTSLSVDWIVHELSVHFRVQYIRVFTAKCQCQSCEIKHEQRYMLSKHTCLHTKLLFQLPYSNQNSN